MNKNLGIIDVLFVHRQIGICGVPGSAQIRLFGQLQGLKHLFPQVVVVILARRLADEGVAEAYREAAQLVSLFIEEREHVTADGYACEIDAAMFQPHPGGGGCPALHQLAESIVHWHGG